ncbi:MAG: hypothetical protein D6765_00890 [Bacteroidetes bacterium]|nr:MAG: hypothetical protein D6765_00890 [Bacteroidota bacterium]
MAWYYQALHPGYRPLPPLFESCRDAPGDEEAPPMSLIYPQTLARIVLPHDLSGEPTHLVFKAAHRNPDAKIFWHLDETFLGSTEDFHHLACLPSEGMHRLVLVDDQGNRLERKFEIVRSR